MEVCCLRTLLSVFLSAVSMIGGRVTSDEAASSICSPSSDLSELARATVAAYRVFEGRLETLGGPSAEFSTRFAAGQLNATFAILRSYKGNLKRISRASSRSQIVVGLISPAGDDQVPRTDSLGQSCSVSELLELRQKYLVFVGRPARSRNSDGNVYFQSTAFPVPSTKNAIRQIRAYKCRKCGRIRARLVVNSPDVLEGQTTHLLCRASGKPVEEILWFKDRQRIMATEHVKFIRVKKGSRMVIEKATSEDSGTYQCRAKNAVTTTPLSSAATVNVQPAEDVDVVAAEGHETLCANQDYCMNLGVCYTLRSLGRKFCRCRSEYYGPRCQEKQVPSNIPGSPVKHFNWWMASGGESLVITGIAVATLLIACFLITAFCIARSYCSRKKRRRVARSDSDYRPPSLPDGHAVNVVQLNAAINRRSGAYSINLGADNSIEPVVNCDQQALSQLPNPQFPVLRRATRSNASSIANIGPSRGSAHVRLSMLSTASSQQGAPRLPAISSTADAEVPDSEFPETSRPIAVEQRPEVDVARGDQDELEGFRQTEVAANAGATSPRASQCSHTESLLCGVTGPNEAVGGDDICSAEIHSEASTAPRRHSLTTAAVAVDVAACSDVSYDDEDDYENNFFAGDDLEVNFESEADMLAVETSGDELERGGVMTSRDFSEVSSQMTTDRGSSDDEDDDDISDDPFSRQHLIGLLGARTHAGSSGDLSWDESAEMPSFAVAPTAAEVPLQFSKR